MQSKFFLAAPLVSLACVSSTPVKPAPVAPDEAARLAAALQGTCEVVGVRNAGETEVEDDGAGAIRFTFGPRGKLHTLIDTSLARLEQDNTYRLEGRNLVTDGSHGTFRVDDYSTNTIQLFVYDQSKTFYCKKQ